MNGTGQQGDAALSDLVAEVMAGDANGTCAGGAQDIQIQVVPLLSGGSGTGENHRSETGAQRCGMLQRRPDHRALEWRWSKRA